MVKARSRSRLAWRFMADAVVVRLDGLVMEVL